MKKTRSRPAPSVGVRELRQNLSVYLDRVKEGERLEVTERGHAVALLVPLPAGSDRLERLEAEGKLSPARGDFRSYLRTRRPLPAAPSGRTLSEVLAEMRDEERF